MVVDLGLLRVDRQTDKSAADAASMAGIHGMVPDVNNPSFHPFAGVCQALDYLRANSSNLGAFASEKWTDGTGSTVAAPDCSATDSRLCSPNAPTTWARFTGTTSDGRSKVTIQAGYHVTDGDASTPDPATDGNIANVTGGDFPEDGLASYVNDTGTPTDPTATDYGGCEQLAVFLNEQRNTQLGVQAASKMGTRIRSVGRVSISPPITPFALLILERHDCQVLENTSNGTIDVQGYGDNPGMIHADSDGTGANCNKAVMVGAKAGGIVAHESPNTGASGQLSTVATSNQSDGIPNVYAAPYPPGTNPISRDLVTRKVLDDVYLGGVTQAVSNAQQYFDAAVAGAPPNDGNTWTQKGCPNNDTWTAQYVFINCSDLNKNLSLPNAKMVVFSGRVDPDIITMPVASRVYVYGATTPAAISVGTQFSMNDQGGGCPTTWDNSKQRAQLIVHTGPLKSNGGLFRACNTTVILMGGSDNGCLPSSSPTYAQNGQVCPSISAPTGPGTGLLSLGGNTNIDWTAPDLDDDNEYASQADHDQLEDLALWTETYGVHTLGGGGTMHLMGVFAAPNAYPMKLNGGPVQNVLNSQYVTRELWTTGSGTLEMQPLPSLPVAPPTVGFNLVR